MADYQLVERKGSLVVSIVGYDGPRLPLLRAFQACAEGNCTCPTEHLQTLDALDADEIDGRIELTLRPRRGARLDLPEVQQCLERTLTRFEGVSI